MSSNSEFWRAVWRDHTRKHSRDVPMVRAMRTTDGQPFTDQQWQAELRHILRLAQVRKSDAVLDLCCGNGLVTEEVASRCRRVVAVDYVPSLVAELKRRRIPNVVARSGDIRRLKLPRGTFDLVLVCAGIQYLTERETLHLLADVHRWLRPGGRVCLLHIADVRRLWHYAATPAKRDLYFERIQTGRQLVGTWYDRPWFDHAAHYLGYRRVAVRSQPRSLRYSHYRFDVLMKK